MRILAPSVQVACPGAGRAVVRRVDQRPIDPPQRPGDVPGRTDELPRDAPDLPRYDPEADDAKVRDDLKARAGASAGGIGSERADPDPDAEDSAR